MSAMRSPSSRAAKHCGLSNKQIQSAFDTFKGIKRRMEVRASPAA